MLPENNTVHRDDFGKVPKHIEQRIFHFRRGYRAASMEWLEFLASTKAIRIESHI